MNKTSTDKESVVMRLYNKVMNMVNYCISGVWKDPRDTIWIRVLKSANLTMNSFLDKSLQIRSMSLTYSTVLALVPALALLVAIGRGFGLQNMLQQQLFQFFPSQAKALGTALTFVDSCLNQASQGLFVGIGIVMLLWTVISLLSSIEDAFNSICDIKKGRSFYQKITDYIAICLLVPILMICSSGVSIFMSTTIQDNLNLPFFTPIINILLELSPVVLAWLAFSLSFCIIPNTKINFKYAMISGAICAVLFQVLQMLFVGGQIYVSKYNAIYGSFAFLPLMLVWLQVSWLILLSGCVLTYSLQNVFTFNFLGDDDDISPRAMDLMSIIVMGIVVQNFIARKNPESVVKIASDYNLPVRIVTKIVNRLYEAKFIFFTDLKNGSQGLTPALTVTHLSVGELISTLVTTGENECMPRFNELYAGLLSQLKTPLAECYNSLDMVLLKDLKIPSPEEISEILKHDAEEYTETIDKQKKE